MSRAYLVKLTPREHDFLSRVLLCALQAIPSDVAAGELREGMLKSAGEVVWDDDGLDRVLNSTLRKVRRAEELVR